MKGNPIVQHVRVFHGEKHDRILVWNDKGLLGELVSEIGEGPFIAMRLLNDPDWDEEPEITIIRIRPEHLKKIDAQKDEPSATDYMLGANYYES